MLIDEKIKVAVLVANGFNLDDLIKTQKVMTGLTVGMKIISVNHGLVNAWDENSQGWGHNYAVDKHLNSALGVDYDVLIIPSGTRSIEKLKMTAHTRRFISSFMSSNKPVAVMGDAIEIIKHSGAVDTRQLSEAHDERRVDMNLLTGSVDDTYFDKLQGLLAQIDMEQAA